MSSFSMEDVPYEKWSVPALVKKVQELEGDLRRKELTLDESGKRNISLQAQMDHKTVTVPRKRKGVVDGKSWERIREVTWNQIASNLLTACITVPGMIAAGEFSLWLGIHILTSACFGPIIKYLQKRSEVH